MNKINYRSPREKIEIKILNFCEDIQAPIYAYDMLMTMLSTCNITMNTFVPDFTRRNVLIGKLKREVEMEECEPQVKEVTLDSGKK